MQIGKKMANWEKRRGTEIQQKKVLQVRFKMITYTSHNATALVEAFNWKLHRTVKTAIHQLHFLCDFLEYFSIIQSPSGNFKPVCCYFTFTHLANAFIQSSAITLHCITLTAMHARSLGIEPMTLTVLVSCASDRGTGRMFLSGFFQTQNMSKGGIFICMQKQISVHVICPTFMLLL